MSRVAVDSDPPGSKAGWITLAGLAALACYGWFRATRLAWLCDDAFISIRYAENLANGLGLVYNAGEYVEGYTNLLWTLMLAGAARSGAAIVDTAQYLGVVWYAALVVTLAHRSWQRAGSGRAFVPLAAAIVAVSDDFQVWASGGLETSLFAWLAVQSLVLTRRPPTHTRSVAAGGLLALLVMTRPDGLLFAVAGLLSYWFPRDRLEARERVRYAVGVAAPVLALLAIGIPAKLHYYGDFLPTAFYSKSVLDPYVSQGLWYVGLYLWKNWFLLAAAVVAVVVRRHIAPAVDRDGWFYLSTAAVFTLYLIEVGGDFMFARRLIPVVPLVLIALEDRIAAMTAVRWRTLTALGLLIAAALPAPLYGDGHDPRGIEGIYDERRSYPPETLSLRERQAAEVAAALGDLPVRVAFEGGMCVFGYYSGLPYLAEMTGLTQYSLAKQPLAERADIGHEKSPSRRWFTENRIHLLIKQDLPPLPDPAAIDEIRFGDRVRGQILLYSDEIMDPLRGRPDVSFTPIEDVIDRSQALMESGSLEDAERVYQQIDRYYFQTAGERGREPAARLRAIIERKRASRPSGEGRSVPSD